MRGQKGIKWILIIKQNLVLTELCQSSKKQLYNTK